MVKGIKVEWGTCSRTVSFGSTPTDLSYWNNILAVGLKNGDIIILDTITGSQIAALSGHTDYVSSVAFSLDGRLLVSGSHDKTVKLWDVQTGGVARTFYGHTDWVRSISVSVDCTRIASGADDHNICLWDIQTGKCYHTIKQKDEVHHINFSPTDPRYLISISGGRIQQWDVNGHEVPPLYNGTHIAFSPDHAQFALCNGKAVTVQNSHSRAIVAEFHVTNAETQCCYFSPDGRLVAVAAGNTVYVWDITTPDPHLIDTFVGHADGINSLVFSSSSLISASNDKLIKFWQIGALSTDIVTPHPQPTLPTLAVIESVSLQAKSGIAISSDSAGVVKTWDISTGICKVSFQTPAGQARFWTQRDAQLIDNRVIFIWYDSGKIYIWDTEKGEILQTLNTTKSQGLRISGDGSKIISLGERSIRVWSMWTWELVDKVELGLGGELYLDSLCIEGSRVYIHSKDSSAQEGWNFGILGSSPAPFNPSTGRPHLDFVGGARWQTENPPWIKDTATGKAVFQLGGIYVKPNDVQWDGQYLVAGYDSGEVLILDFYHALSKDV